MDAEAYRSIYGHIGFRVSHNYGHLFRDPHGKDYSILGVYIGVPLFWETTIVCLGFRMSLSWASTSVRTWGLCGLRYMLGCVGVCLLRYFSF